MRKIKTAIFGGSFDPPHIGHIEIIGHLMQTFSKVIVVPTYISPFKSSGSYASPNQRLEMLNLALAEQGLSPIVSDYEIKKGGISYSYQTIQHFIKEDEQIYFVIGSESVPTLHLWKNAEWLKLNVIFYVIGRENFDIKLRDDFRLEIAPFIQKDYSSSLFKAAHAFGRGEEVVSKKVLEYINEQNLYKAYHYLTYGFKVFNLTEKRINHTYRAVKKGIMLAKIHGEDVDKAITSLTLHDIGKYATAQLLQGLNITPSDTSGMPDSIKHAVYGADIAKQYYKIQDQDILNAILYHTTGRENMSRLEKITAIADYIEDGREFDTREELERTAKESLDKAMADMLKRVIEHLQNSEREIYVTSKKALCFYNKLVYNK